MTTTTAKAPYGNWIISSCSNHHTCTVSDKVEEWNWNASIFEIYDEIKDWNDQDIHKTLKHAFHFFNQDKMINELASFLLGQGFDDDDTDDDEQNDTSANYSHVIKV